MNKKMMSFDRLTSSAHPKILPYFNQAPLVHNSYLAPEILSEILVSGVLKNKFKKPDNLTIILCHNFQKKTLLEVNLEYVGIDDYVLLNKPVPYWSHINKLKWIWEYLKEGKCKTEYLLYLDSTDVALKGDPADIVDIFKSYDCDFLISTVEGGTQGYACMPEVKKWTDNIFEGLYLCAGVYMGRSEYILQVFDEGMKYVVDDYISRDEYLKLGRGIPGDTRLCERLPEYPKGLGSDQHILRYLHPKFYPNMKLDYYSRLCYRKLMDVELVERLEKTTIL